MTRRMAPTYADLLKSAACFRDEHPELRFGQAAFGYVAQRYGPAVANRAAAAHGDPFYDDAQTASFLHGVVLNLLLDEQEALRRTLAEAHEASRAAWLNEQRPDGPIGNETVRGDS